MKKWLKSCQSSILSLVHGWKMKVHKRTNNARVMGLTRMFCEPQVELLNQVCTVVTTLHLRLELHTPYFKLVCKYQYCKQDSLAKCNSADVILLLLARFTYLYSYRPILVAQVLKQIQVPSKDQDN